MTVDRAHRWISPKTLQRAARMGIFNSDEVKRMTVDQIVWPESDCTTYVYKGKGKERHRFYRHLELGWEYPGVTTILKPWDKEGLLNWAANLEREAVIDAALDVFQTAPSKVAGLQAIRELIEAKLGHSRQHVKKKEAAASIGTGAHSMIQWRLKKIMGESPGPMPQIGVESTVAVMAWQKHWESAGITPLRIEQPVWSMEHGYAGQADLIGIRDGKVGVVDLKTAKGLYPTNHMQVEAYARAVEETTGLEIEWAELWRLPKSMEDLSFEVKELGDLRVWNGQELEPKRVSRTELFESFLGIKVAYEALVAPHA